MHVHANVQTAAGPTPLSQKNAPHG